MFFGVVFRGVSGSYKGYMALKAFGKGTARFLHDSFKSLKRLMFWASAVELWGVERALQSPKVTGKQPGQTIPGPEW